MEENNEDHEVDLDANVIDYIIGQFQNQSDNSMSLEQGKTNTNNKKQKRQ